MAGNFSIKNLLQAVRHLATEESSVPAARVRYDMQQQEIENALLVLAAEVLRCRQQLTTASEEFITLFFEKQFGQQNAQVRLQNLRGHIFNGTSPLLKMACTELNLLTTAPSRVHMVDFLFGLAGADDVLTPRDLRCLQRISNYLKVPVDEFVLIKEKYVELYDPYAVLGCSESDSMEAIKAAYRKLVLKHHPDKQGAQGSSEKHSRKFRQIKQAYETIRQQRKNRD